MVDRMFAERMRKRLGDPDDIELTPTGRTVLRYPRATTVCEVAGRPVAARMDHGNLPFAKVPASGELAWQSRHPYP